MAKRSAPRANKREKNLAPRDYPVGNPLDINGLIIGRYGQTFDVEDASGVVHRCTARKKIGALVCGDEIIWQITTTGDGVIVALRPRRSLLVRPSARGDLKPMAANVDQLLVVMAPRPGTDALIDTALIDRYLVAAELCGLRATMVVNKADLLDSKEHKQISTSMDIYRTVGYRVLFTSAKQRFGIDALVSTLAECTSALVGPSGVGKSSLARTLLPGRDISVGEVSAAGTGRHTTTVTVLYHLPQGGNLIDSPGVRDFALWHATPAEIALGFVEFRSYAPSCRFGDCLHVAEPDCAVQRGVAIGKISAIRYASYRRMLETRDPEL